MTPASEPKGEWVCPGCGKGDGVRLIDCHVPLGAVLEIRRDGESFIEGCCFAYNLDPLALLATANARIGVLERERDEARAALMNLLGRIAMVEGVSVLKLPVYDEARRALGEVPR